jgi:hypothetical protein
MSKTLSERVTQELESRSLQAWESLRGLAYQAAKDESKVDATKLAKSLEDVGLCFDDFEKLIEVALQRQEARAAIAGKTFIEKESVELQSQAAELEAESVRQRQALAEKLRPIQTRLDQLQVELRRIDSGETLLDQAPTEPLREQRRSLQDRLQRLQNEQKGQLSSWRRETIGPEIEAAQRQLAEVESQIRGW